MLWPTEKLFIGYAIIIAMAATSFDRAAAAIGPRAWRALHLLGGYYLCAQFVVSFGKRIPAMPLVRVRKITGPITIFTKAMNPVPSGAKDSPKRGKKYPMAPPARMASST